MAANITIAAGAEYGFRDVFVITGGETAALLSGFNIIGGPPTAQPPTGLCAAPVTGDLVTLRRNAPPNSTAPIFTFSAPTGSFFVRMHTVPGVKQAGPSNEIPIHVNVPVTPSAFRPTSWASGTARASGSRGATPPEAENPSAMLLDVTGSFTGTLPLPMGDSFSFDAVPGGTYTVSLRAANAAGVSPSSNPGDAVVPRPLREPTADAGELPGPPDWQHRLRRLGHRLRRGPPPPDST